jgi:lauroyl/myristoyl acyltransferase
MIITMMMLSSLPHHSPDMFELTAWIGDWLIGVMNCIFVFMPIAFILFCVQRLAKAVRKGRIVFFIRL